MDTQAIFEYNQKTKFWFGLGTIITVLTIITLFILFNAFNVLEGTYIDHIVTYVKAQIYSGTLMGLFLTGLIGGLFFIPVPLELLFLAFVSRNDPLLATVVMLAGLTLSYAFDYYLGYRFSTFSRKLISAKQFYTIKSKLNRYGKIALFIFNVFPLPSQPLLFICGVFRYNKTRVFLYSFAGWVIKLSVIALLYNTIIRLFGL